VVFNYKPLVICLVIPVVIGLALAFFTPLMEARASSPDDYSGIYQWISSPVGQAQIKRGQDLLAGYKTAGADFVNFHSQSSNEFYVKSS